MFISIAIIVCLAASAICAPQQNCGNQAIKPDPAVPRDAQGRIVGGTEAKRNSWPWMGSLRRSSIFGASHSCGGSVISNSWFLTAAHCVEGSLNPASYRIDVGMHHRDNSEPTRVMKQVQRVIMHPDFDTVVDLDEDIALLQFSTPLEFNDYISSVCLPTRRVVDGEDTVITGWGNVQGTCCANWLKQAKVPVVSYAQCTAPGWYPPFDITDNMICIGYPRGGTDTCQGDSGGPVNVWNNNGNGTGYWMVSGLTSWGQGCALPNKPGVYTRVSNYVNWISAMAGVEPPNY